MQQIYTSVLARRIVIDGVYATPPYEAGWASEAVFFVQTEGPHPDLTLVTQVSPDGITWIDRGIAVTLDAADAIAEVPVANFGNWLRVTVTGATDAATARILIHLASKG